MTIFGRGFSEKITGSITNQYESSNQCQSGECWITFVSPNEISIQIPPLRGVKGEENVRALILLKNENFEFEPVEFTYENRKTARVNSIITQYVGKVRKGDDITIKGENFDPSCENQAEVQNKNMIENTVLTAFCFISLFCFTFLSPRK